MCSWQVVSPLNLLGLLQSQVRLAAAVCAKRRLSPEVVRLFTEGGPTEVVLPECTRLDPPCLAAALKDCATPRCVTAAVSVCLSVHTRCSFV